MYTTIQAHVEGSSLLPSPPFGFRKIKSTSWAICTRKTLKNDRVANKHKALAYIIDLKRASDNSDRSIRFRTMYKLGINGHFLQISNHY